ncbi:hypothetical protein BIW11_01240 [Tropilaelaps mercedesae]|uniref:RRM domain-containing protein n=1 Tax=Tropilaelaps mercedesae TaxID=418985 RepID=A0A1V9XHC5_9ACAR|nr:hypothetical protein BIW11_01240 [Tropilaelaps mercedesae]
MNSVFSILVSVVKALTLLVAGKKDSYGDQRRGSRYGGGGGGGGGGGYQGRQQDNHNRIFVGGIGDNVNKEDLESVFSKYGRLTNVWVAQNPPGFAFVDFGESQHATDAVQQMDGQELNGSTLKVAPYRGRRNNRGRGTYLEYRLSLGFRPAPLPRRLPNWSTFYPTRDKHTGDLVHSKPIINCSSARLNPANLGELTANDRFMI